jgi:hypothetical protein
VRTAAAPAPGPLVVYGRIAHEQRYPFVLRNNGIGIVVCAAPPLHASMLFGINKDSPGRTLTSTGFSQSCSLRPMTRSLSRMSIRQIPRHARNVFFRTLLSTVFFSASSCRDRHQFVVILRICDIYRPRPNPCFAYVHRSLVRLNP